MWRVISAIIILAVSISACISEILILNSSINELKGDIQSIEAYVQNNEIEPALDENKTLEDKFQNKYLYMSTFIDHDRLEDIEESILLMSVNLENDNKEDFFVESSKVNLELDNLNNTELPLLGNLL